MTTTMNRIILSLTPKEHEWLREKSRTANMPVSALIRRAIDQFIAVEDEKKEHKQQAQGPEGETNGKK